MPTYRIIIHADIAEQFLEVLKTVLHGLASSATEPPFLVTASSKSRLQKLVSAALSGGARTLFGDTEQLQPKDHDETSPVVFTPMIIGEVNKETSLWREEEAFGPVAAYVLAKNDDEAVQMANDTEFGLSAAIFTEDLRKGFAIAKQLESG